jgi:hypothetical protein
MPPITVLVIDDLEGVRDSALYTMGSSPMTGGIAARCGGLREGS